jgi:hypothetical protein
MAKAAFNKKQSLFASKMNYSSKKELVKYYIWDIVLYGALTWTPRK